MSNVLDELIADLDGDPYRDFDAEDVKRMLTRVVHHLKEREAPVPTAPAPTPVPAALPSKVFVVMCNDAVVAAFPDEKVAGSVCRKLKNARTGTAFERPYFWHVKEAVTSPERAWVEGRALMGLK